MTMFLHACRKKVDYGFTLIEISIVLVIIGLIVGGVLVGRDLISAAEIRSQIAQIDQYNVAVNTFKLKYGYLPGDIPEPHASSFGFDTRGGSLGEGDGNGIVQSSCEESGSGCPWNDFFLLGIAQVPGIASENILFWADLSKAGLIAGSFINPTIGTDITETSSPALPDYFPRGKISGNYISVWSGGMKAAHYVANYSDSKNYFSLSVMTKIRRGTFFAVPFSYSGLTVSQAYSMDSKMDDGLPQSGKVLAMIPTMGWYAAWAHGSNISVGGYTTQGTSGAYSGVPFDPTTTATSYSSANCYDNNGVAGVQKYQLRNADSLNCSLSFRF